MVREDNKLGVVLISILYLILGIVFIAATDSLLKTFNYTLICICAIIGVIQLISFFVSKKYKDGHYSDLVMAVVFIWVSLILYEFDGFNILPVVFSLYLFIMSTDFFVQFLQKNELVGIDRWKYFILCVISVAIALLLIFNTGTLNPGKEIFIYLRVTGVYLVIIAVWYFYGFVKSFKK